MESKLLFYLSKRSLAQHFDEIEICSPYHILFGLRMCVCVATHHWLLALRRLLLELKQVLLIIRTGHVIVLALILSEQLEPAIGGILDDLRNAKR